MTNLTRLLTLVMIATYLGFFVVEAILWTVPFVHRILLPQLNPGLAYPAATQVAVLRALFVNQGVYNLLLGIGGVAGLKLWKHGEARAGQVLISFLSLFAIGAALTLLVTTHAYLLGVVQLVVPVALLRSLRRDAERAQRLRPQHRR